LNFKIERVLEVLPFAPPALPRKLTEKEEEALVRNEETSLRELRIFLRQTLDKMSRMKQYVSAPKHTVKEIIYIISDQKTIIEKKFDYCCCSDAQTC
jgi:hypothetical protein